MANAIYGSDFFHVSFSNDHQSSPHKRSFQPRQCVQHKKWNQEEEVALLNVVSITPFKHAGPAGGLGTTEVA